MSDRYKLDGHETVVVHDLIEWATWMESAERAVCKDQIGDSKVSTVFLGLDHAAPSAVTPPLLFETMVFGGPMDDECRHYATWGQAEAGHAEMMAEVQAAIGKAAG